MPIKNLTPHAIALFSLDQVPAEPQFYRTSGGWLRVARRTPDGDAPLGYTQWNPESISARVVEERSDIDTLSYPDLDNYEGPGALPGNVIEVVRKVPVRSVRYGAISGLPDFAKGDFYIVSMPVALAARAAGRRTDDLLTVGDLIRDPKGEIAGVTSFYRGDLKEGLEVHAQQLIRVNAQMFEGTLSVLGQQNIALLAENARLRQEVDDAARLRQEVDEAASNKKDPTRL